MKGLGLIKLNILVWICNFSLSVILNREAALSVMLRHCRNFATLSGDVSTLIKNFK